MKWPKLEKVPAIGGTRGGAGPRGIVPAVEVVRRLVHEPFASEKKLFFIVEPVVLINLQQRARTLKGYCGWA